MNTEPKDDGTKICPYCAEEIKFAAIKCKHCGEFLVDDKTLSKIKRVAIEPIDQSKPDPIPQSEKPPQILSKKAAEVEGLDPVLQTIPQPKLVPQGTTSSKAIKSFWTFLLLMGWVIVYTIMDKLTSHGVIPTVVLMVIFAAI